MWNSWCTSSPDELKKAIGKQGKFTAINATLIKKKLTRKFGPQGVGWGVEITKAEIHNNIPKVEKVKDEKGHVVGTEIIELPVAVLQGNLWFMYNENCRILPLIVSWPYEADTEVWKKLRTMLISKGAAELGMNADVYEGSWDDNPYVSMVETEAPVELKEEVRELLSGPWVTEEKAKKISSYLKNKNWSFKEARRMRDGLLAARNKHTESTRTEEGRSDLHSDE